jgi:hypothetical protein
LVLEETVCPIGEFLNRIRSTLTSGNACAAKLIFCGTDLTPYAPAIVAGGWPPDAILSVGGCLAGPLAQIATECLQRGLGVDAAAADANYVRLSDAQLFWKA